MECIAFRSVRYLDFARATIRITRDIFIPGPTLCLRTKSQLNKQAKHTTFYQFEEGLSCAEHGKLVAECIFSKSKYFIKAGNFKWKAGWRKKSVSLRPKAVLLTPMLTSRRCRIFLRRGPLSCEVPSRHDSVGGG